MTATDETVDIDRCTSASVIASFHEELTARGIFPDLAYELTIIAAKALTSGTGYLNVRKPSDV